VLHPLPHRFACTVIFVDSCKFKSQTAAFVSAEAAGGELAEQDRQKAGKQLVRACVTLAGAALEGRFVPLRTLIGSKTLADSQSVTYCWWLLAPRHKRKI
jgi:hypothetical protein